MKQVRKLTELAVEKLKPGAERCEVADGGGLYLVVHPSGQKSWAVRYRHDGQSRKLTLNGIWPAIDLATARKLATKALRQVADGRDPAVDKKAARHRAADIASDFPGAVAVFLDKYITRKGRRPRASTIEQLAAILGMERESDAWKPKKGGLADRWRARKVYEVTKADVRAILDEDLGREAPIMANRRRSVLRWFFSWCWRRELIPVNPVAQIEKPAQQAPRDRALDDRELAIVWAASGEEPVYGPLWKILLLTACRREEARAMTWGELNLDAAEWTLPANRTKNGREHLIPLPALVVDILGTQPRIGSPPGYVFTLNGQSPISGISGGKRRLDARIAALAKKAKITFPPFKIHDIRRSTATGLQRLGVDTMVIEKVLNHSPAGLTAVYQKHKFEDEKRAALDAWARHIETIASGTPAKVLPMVKAAR